MSGSNETDHSGDGLPGLSPTSRRGFLGSVVAAAALSTGSARAQHVHGQSVQAPMMHGVLGKAGAAPGRPVIAMLVHPKMVLQDLIGPMTVFNLMHSEIHLVWKTLDPVMSELGIPVAPSTTLAACPADLDILFVPGGLDGSIDMMDDKDVLAFLADRGARARYVTSDCTGALVLGAAGLLRGYKATGHWYIRDELALLGATPVHERVVHDRNRITGGGVTAGIDFGLTLAALIKGEEEAKRIQLLIEYAPEPPFNAGTPETAPRDIHEKVLGGRKPAIQRAGDKAREIAATFGNA